MINRVCYIVKYRTDNTRGDAHVKMPWIYINIKAWLGDQLLKPKIPVTNIFLLMTIIITMNNIVNVVMNNVLNYNHEILAVSASRWL